MEALGLSVAHVQNTDGVMRNPRNGLSDYLLKAGLLDADTIQQSMLKAKNQQSQLSTYLVKQRLISNETLLACCKSFSGLPEIDIEQLSIETLQTSPISTALQFHYRFIVIEYDQKKIKIALADPTHDAAISAIGFQTQLRVELYLIDECRLDYYLNTYCKPDVYSQVAQALSSMQVLEEKPTDMIYAEEEEEPIITLVNRLIQDAVEKKVSDIHIEPLADQYRVRYRRDGLLYTHANIPSTLGLRITTRLKILGKLNIAEKRLPQDGRILFDESVKIDIRLNTCSTIYGEKLALRLLATLDEHLSIDSLGLDAAQQTILENKLAQPQGLILVTGPTGSGKTRTLYAALKHINLVEKNIISIEDPVEIELSGINQVNIDSGIGLDFATTLRAVLRQDPDIIMIGEIRDKETAQIAIQAAQTGHLVLSTMHTNHAVESMQRLESMGIDTTQLISTTELIISQRLIRKRCQRCQHGCAECHQGYRGRTGIFELLTNLKTNEIAQSLWQSGLRKIQDGITDKNELIRMLGTTE